MQEDQAAWLSRMDVELENVRVALDWCREDPSTAELALCASFGIWDYWDMRGHADELCQRFEELLALLPPGPPSAGRLMGQALLAHGLGTRGDFERGGALMQATLAIEREVSDPIARFWCRGIETEYLLFSGSPTTPAVARALLTQEQSPMSLGAAFLPWFVGEGHLNLGELDEAERMLRLGAETSKVERWRAYAVDRLGILAYRRGDPTGAQAWFLQALASFARVGEYRGRAHAVEQLGCVAGQLEQWERAARLLGAAEMLFDLSSQIPYPRAQLEPEKIASASRDHLGERAFAAAHAAGRAMSVDRAVQYALEPDVALAPARSRDGSIPLTRREREVASLVAQGLSNRQIGERLVIGERTVESHVSHMLTRLDLPSRARLAAWAVEQGIIPPERQAPHQP
jgi:non-specific serine/threonine protein kinase